MTKATGRAAVMVMAGWVLLMGAAAQAAPAPETPSRSESAGQQAETARPGKHRRHATRRSGSKIASTKTDKATKEDGSNKAGQTNAAASPPASSQLPPDVANANAQVAAAETPTATAASAMTNRANENLQAAAATPPPPQAETQAAAPDQVSDPDRALPQDNPPQNTVLAGSDAQPRQAPAGPAAVSSSEHDSAWDQSSLIGKIFIGVGALLTFASAARMFMA